MSEAAPAPAEARHSARPRASTRQVWAERLQRFAASGLRPVQFCAKEGVSLPSFYSWKRRLAAGAGGPATPAPGGPGPRRLPVRLQPAAAAVELALPTGAVVRIPPGAAEATLGWLLRLLGVAPC